MYGSENIQQNENENEKKEAQECLRIVNGLNKAGLNIAFDSLLANKNNLYSDFSQAQLA